MKSNSRTPETLQGDLLAQIAAGSMGAKRMSKLVSEYGINFFNKGVEALLDYTEKLTREEIRKIPDGV